MGRYDSSVRCGQIRELIEEKQYLQAMEEIEQIPFKEVPTITELYRYAELFLKAEKMDVAKELYYTVYQRTSSRPSLYRLLMLVIRMGDLEEARELYQAYEIVSGFTLDTYELKYRLAKAEGASYDNLIEILEELKRNEYTEEWGYQLALLYERQGRREDCIAECEDLIRWFGHGKIVDKAKALREHCLSPLWEKPVEGEIPEPEEPEMEEVKVAYAPAQVMEIVAEEEPTMEKTAMEVEEPEPEIEEEAPEETLETAEEEMSEPEEQEESEPEPEPEEEAPEETLETLEEEMPEPEDQEEPEPEPEEQEEPEETDAPKKGFFGRLINYFKVDLDTFEDDEEFPEELDTYKNQSTAELDAKAIVAKEAQQIMEVPAQKEEVAEKVEEQENVVKKRTTAPIESLEEQLEEMKENRKVINLEDTMNLDKIRVKTHPLSGHPMEIDVCEDVSNNGITYCTLKSAIQKMPKEERTIHFALTGAAPGISLAVAKKLFKELKKNQYFEAKNIGKIHAEKLDEVDLDEWIEKFIGGCMYIENAPALSEKSIAKIRQMMEKYEREIVVILEGDYEKMDDFLSHHRNLEKQICYKIRL
ncbi:MAG: hypothetical protein MRZ84_04035 [Eubacterium sp.]|nr:hypothetical protein [Eubacterium sp.]